MLFRSATNKLAQAKRFEGLGDKIQDAIDAGVPVRPEFGEWAVPHPDSPAMVEARRAAREANAEPLSTTKAPDGETWEKMQERLRLERLNG